MEAMRSFTAVGTGGGGGGGDGGGRSSFNTQDQSRGERPRSVAFASLYLVPPPHSYTLENAPFFTRLDIEKKKKRGRKTRVRRVPVEIGGIAEISTNAQCGAGVYRRIGRREACCEVALPSIRPLLPRLPRSLAL